MFFGRLAGTRARIKSLWKQSLLCLSIWHTNLSREQKAASEMPLPGMRFAEGHRWQH
jgi:hypothetical protein